MQAGDLLAEIDPRPYQNALLQAEGTLLQNQAQLKNAQVDVERYRGLYREDSIAKATEAIPDAAEIFERNIRLLEEMGHEGWQKLGLPQAEKE